MPNGQHHIAFRSLRRAVGGLCLRRRLRWRSPAASPLRAGPIREVRSMPKPLAFGWLRSGRGGRWRLVRRGGQAAVSRLRAGTGLGPHPAAVSPAAQPRGQASARTRFIGIESAPAGGLILMGVPGRFCLWIRKIWTVRRERLLIPAFCTFPIEIQTIQASCRRRKSHILQGASTPHTASGRGTWMPVFAGTQTEVRCAVVQPVTYRPIPEPTN